MKLLITRPQPGADATASRAAEAGFDAVTMPLFAIEPLDWDVPSAASYDALMVTSGNAVRYAGAGLQKLRRLPLYVVGSATAREADRRGLSSAFVGDEGVDVVLTTIDAAGYRRVLWLAGEDHIDPRFPADMNVDIRTVYRSAALKAPADFTEKVTSCDAVMLHSPRAGRHFSELCKAQTLNRSAVTIAALSPAIAESAGSDWRGIVIAATPNDAALLSRLQSSFTSVRRDP